MILSTFDRLPIAHKLLAVVSGSALILGAGLGTAAYLTGAKYLTDSADEKLSGLAESRRDAMRDYLSSIQSDLAVLSGNPLTLDALNDFRSGWAALGPNAGDQLQKLYITDNPNPAGKKENLDFAPDGSAYSAAHAEHHAWLRDFLRQRGYYDIFLFDRNGDIVYTVFKELDFATNARNGKWSQTDLGKVYGETTKLDQGGWAFIDFKAYEPSNNVPASFIAAPIFDASGTRVGAIAFQMPLAQLNHIMKSTAGLGATGQSYVVGADALLRTDAPRAGEPTTLKASADAAIAATALSGEAAALRATGISGNPVLVGAAPLEFGGAKWSVVAEVDRDEALAGLASLRNQMLMLSLGLLMATAGVGYVLARRISRPVEAIAGATRRIADGDLSAEVPGRERGDELGPLATAIDSFRAAIIEGNALADRQRRETDERARAASERTEKMSLLTSGFESTVRSLLQETMRASSQLDNSSTAMSSIAAQTASQSATVSAASQLAASNVQSVAAATEELSASINEISDKIQESSRSTQSAVTRADSMRKDISALQDAANSIGEVVELITSIASQTNLLALNATIEAARAGDAGRGFGVVASEVKGLADQTAKATGDIQRQIAAIQGGTRLAVDAVGEIASMIGELERASTQIAAAVVEQSAATQEISRSVQQAAGGVQEVDSNIANVTRAADETGQTAAQVREAGEVVATSANRLQSEVESFLAGVRAA
jgi:methyl-accepting chemotaxis protein